MDLRSKIRQLPEAPGVYLMKDSHGNIIYVGKSKKLKSRVGQYFVKSKKHPPKILKMVQSIRDFEYIITDTEFEALLLECRLIKEIKPMYNSQMKNDRGYIYIRITVEERFPRIMTAKEKLEEGSMYFGPYKGQSSIERAVMAIRENLQIRSCSGAILRPYTRGCLSYDLGFCSGPCSDGEAAKVYLDRINEAVSFLEGRDMSLLARLEDKMMSASMKHEFDKAARYRDDLYALRHIKNSQRAIGFVKRVRSIAVIEPLGNSEIKLFLIRGRELLYAERFVYSSIERCSIIEKIRDAVFNYLKPDKSGQKISLGKQDLDQAHIIYSYLKNHKNNCRYIVIPSTWLEEVTGSKLCKGIKKLLGVYGAQEDV